ncbi:MAG: hypothetical protein M3209_18050 [Acidobacteriota bacterium]|nr:hypothetical protein [Acidobacteriota bacterium]
MKHSRVGAACFAFLAAFLLTVFNISAVNGQKRRSVVSKNPTKIVPATRAPSIAVVIDERLSVLRFEPSLLAIPLQRMSAGRTMQITGSRQADDGLVFYRVQLPMEKSGWIQAEAVVRTDRREEDARLLRLIRASDGFEQIERAVIFLENFPNSEFRPAVLLLLGDLVESVAQRLSRDATRRFNQDEINANEAPLHSFYLNYNGLDRYRRLGIGFLFNRKTKQFHYDGTAWREIVQKHKQNVERTEAQKRLDALAEKMK